MLMRTRLNRYASSLFGLKAPPVKPSTRARYSAPSRSHLGNSAFTSSDKRLLPEVGGAFFWAKRFAVMDSNIRIKTNMRCIGSSLLMDMYTVRRSTLATTYVILLGLRLPGGQPKAARDSAYPFSSAETRLRA